MLVLINSSVVFPSFRKVVIGMMLTAAPPSTNILLFGFSLTKPLMYNAFRCRCFDFSGFSNIACCGSNTNCAVIPSRNQ
uniref:Uncharacterized protein n=1 Tax=Arundo donax TaxID=35708 RepID=A0A0A9EX15_ARUDO